MSNNHRLEKMALTYPTDSCILSGRRSICMKLGPWLKKNKWNAAKLSNALGISHTAATKLKRGGRPKPENARKIVAITSGEVAWEDLYPANGIKKASNG